jgi:hypothetical protein
LTKEKHNASEHDNFSTTVEQGKTEEISSFLDRHRCSSSHPCVAQFSADSQQAVKLEELQAITSSSKRINFVKEQGWATMPGETDPDNRVASACTKQLMLIGE